MLDPRSRPDWLTDEVLGVYERGRSADMGDVEWSDYLAMLARRDCPSIPSYVAVYLAEGFRPCDGKREDLEVLLAADSQASGRQWRFDVERQLFTCSTLTA